MPKVSILMNAYNAQKYLKEAIDSVYAQTFQDWEIIFIDNCSTDDTKKIVDTYDEKIKYYKTEKNIPLGAARNYGLQFCNSEYLAFLDTDDVWISDKLSKQIEIMDNDTSIKLCYSNVIYIDNQSKTIGSLQLRANNENIFEQQLRRYEINMQSVLLRNSNDINMNENLRHSPDYDLFMRIISKDKGYALKENLVKYRKLENSLTAKNIDVWWKEMKFTLDELFADEDLKSKYVHLIPHAYAKVAYYKARYLVENNQVDKARKELSNYKFTSPIYLIVFILLYLPKQIWDKVHKIK